MATETGQGRRRVVSEGAVFTIVAVVVAGLLLVQLVAAMRAVRETRSYTDEATRDAYGYVGEIVADGVLDETEAIEQQLARLAADASTGRIGASDSAVVAELVQRISVNDGTRGMLIAQPDGTLAFARRTDAGYTTRFIDPASDQGARVETYDANRDLTDASYDDVTVDVQTRNWYETAVALAPGELGWSAPELGSVTGDPNVWASAPLYVDGEFAGVVAVGLRLSVISEVLTDLPIGAAGGEAYVMTADRVIVAAPQSRVAEVDAYTQANGTAVPAVALGVVTDNPATDVPGAQVFGTDGNLVTLETRLSDRRGLDWILHVRADDATVLPGIARVDSAVRWLAGTIAATILLGAFAALFVRRPFDRIRSHAATDPLTGIANRRELLAAGALAIREAARDRHQVAVAVFDIDDFKEVNDNYGHDAGDDALVRIAQALKVETRAGDLVARLGGDEFVALLVLRDGANVEAAVERLRSQLEVEMAEFISKVPGLGVTVGFAQSHGDFDSTMDVLLYEADQALVQGKRRGKGSAYQLQTAE